MSDRWMARLSDYLDGELTPAENAQLEAHLAEDAACAAALDDLRRVVNRAQHLEDESPPRVEQIWVGIAERIGSTATRDKWVSRLSDYLDGEMSPAERGRLEAHAAEDEKFAATLESLRRVVHRARALDDSVPPQTQQMWVKIARRIGATPPTETAAGSVVGRLLPWRARRFSVSVPQLLAAGIALVLLSGAGSWLARGARSSGDELPTAGLDQAAAGGDSTQATFASVGATRYDEAVADLVKVLEEERELLKPETIRIVEENIAIIDRAIERSRQALVQDPESDYLRRHLEQTMRQKLTLLQRVTTISSAL